MSVRDGLAFFLYPYVRAKISKTYNILFELCKKVTLG